MGVTGADRVNAAGVGVEVDAAASGEGMGGVNRRRGEGHFENV